MIQFTAAALFLSCLILSMAIIGAIEQRRAGWVLTFLILAVLQAYGLMGNLQQLFK